MRSETIAIHSGYEVEPTTKAVAVPIYQTVACEFDSADHGAALFNLEAEGYRYSRIANPTTDVLERRVAALEGGVEALAVSSGQAALNYAILNLMEPGANIVSVPQLYGTTHTLFAHVLPSQGFGVRFAPSDAPAAMEKLIDHNTKGLFCESVGNPAGNICDIGALADLAHRHGIPLVVDNTVATPILLRPIDYGADIVVHSLTKFLGGHGTTMGGIIVDGGQFPWKEHAQRFPMFCTPDKSYHGLVYADHFGAGAYIARCRSVFQRTTGAVLAPLSAFLLLQGIETVALRVERHVENARRVAEFLRDDPRVGWVNASCAGAEISGRARLLTAHLRDQGRLRGRQEILRRAAAVQAAGQHGRCQVARLPSGFHHPPADVGGGAEPRRRAARDDSPERRNRAYRRHHRGS
jgi:O-acetylhomoserine (thiol)-lyase